MACTSLLVTSCKKDFTSPNAAPADAVFTNAKATMGVAVGIHRTYSMTVVPQMVSSNAITTNEAIVVNVGNVSEALLAAGGSSVDGNNGLLTSIWTNNCKVIYDANNVLTTANKLADPSYKSGLVAYASILKALALGNLCMYWEQVPDTVGNATSNPTKFITKAAGFAKCVSLMDNAIALVTANAPSAAFNADLPAGINIINTLHALRARYSLYLGNYAAALSSATTASATVTSTFNFDALNPNQIFLTVTSTNNVYQPRDSTLGLPPSLAPSLIDARVQFYTTLNASAPRYRMRGFFTAATQAIPIYLNDELKLIRAECLVRQATPDLLGAKTLIDQVLQQAASADPNGVGANIATGYVGLVDAASLLDEIYRNRCIELYMSGLKLEDMRRFNRPNSEMKRKFFPYPLRERDNNTNTPADPAF